MKPFIPRILAPTVLLLLLSGCGGGIKVTYDVDRAFNFSGVKTFDWLEPDVSKDRLYRNINPGRTAAIKSMVKRQLKAKGITQQSTDPDLYLLFYADAVTGSSTQSTSGDYSFGVGSGGSTPSSTKAYVKGGLVFEAYDPATDKAVWRGRSKTKVSDSSTEISEKIIQVIDKTFKQFPPT